MREYNRANTDNSFAVILWPNSTFAFTFSCINLSRKLGLDTETIIRNSNRKFEKRFKKMENIICSFLPKIMTEFLELALQSVKIQKALLLQWINQLKEVFQ